MVAAVLAISGCSEERREAPTPEGTTVTSDRVTAELPVGWSRISSDWRGPYFASNPQAILVASSSPIEFERPKDVCDRPDDALSELGKSGALVEVTETDPRWWPRRSGPIKLNRRTYGAYECSGESHSLGFREGSRGMQVHVWFDPDRVDPAVRQEAVGFVNSLEVREFGSGECRRSRVGGFEGADGLSCDEAAELWRSWVFPQDEPRACPSTFARLHHISGTGSVGCRAVEEFVLEDFAPHPGGWIERAGGFDCRIAERPGVARNGITVACIDSARPWVRSFRFRFY